MWIASSPGGLRLPWSAHYPARLAEGAEDVLALGVGERDRRGSWRWSPCNHRLEFVSGT